MEILEELLTPRLHRLPLVSVLVPALLAPNRMGCHLGRDKTGRHGKRLERLTSALVRALSLIPCLPAYSIARWGAQRALVSRLAPSPAAEDLEIPSYSYEFGSGEARLAERERESPGLPAILERKGDRRPSARNRAAAAAMRFDGSKNGLHA
ncbi:hypothetical protein M440DRAFT_1460811 [Trichoderma longibrachiatum ATCC 18648]|uniref:Uncharacterized protein n=1 Tax=Trichoderma longibrachiatum ATCC 18648 TaxID=983965 RepID=A0A2T4CC82_TRILO|nr:hypothetical protein M440DRAFT_1460811 [Trichoderma longibrachiatum ATCC 18648]